MNFPRDFPWSEREFLVVLLCISAILDDDRYGAQSRQGEPLKSPPVGVMMR
jgi:hypothetical protein